MSVLNIKTKVEKVTNTYHVIMVSKCCGKLTRCSWFFIWFSDCCSSAIFASSAPFRSASRRSASSWARFLSSSSSRALWVCSSSSADTHRARHATRSGWSQPSNEPRKHSEKLHPPCWAFLVCSSICFNRSIRSSFSFSIFSFSFSASSRFLFSFSSRALMETK